MKLSNADKRQNTIDLASAINRSEIVDELERVQDTLEEFVNYEQIFKKDYYVLRKKLNDRLCYLKEKGCI